MPNIGPLELAIVVIIALVIFGPKKLPELGSSLGRGMREFKSSISGDDDKDETLTVSNEFGEPAEDAEPTPVDEAAEDLEAQTVAR